MFGSQTRPGMRGSNSLGSLGGCSIAGSSLAGDTLGARTYKLEPLGSQSYVLEPLGASGGGDPFKTFGQRAAAVLISSVQQLPPGQRSSVMRQAMTRIDPTLPARAEKLTAEARARGLSPAAALQQGIAAAMATGVVGELATLGRTRRMPGSSSLLGLGRQALGAVNVFTAGTTSTAAALVTCTGYSWDGSAWVRTKVGQADVPGPGKGCPSVTVHQTAPVGQMIRVGPFLLTLRDRVPEMGDESGLILSRYEDIPDDIKDVIRSAALRGTLCRYTLDTLKEPEMAKRLAPWFNMLGISPSTPFDAAMLGMCPPSPVGNFLWSPVAKAKHPVTGEDMGVHILLERLDKSRPWAGVSSTAPNPIVMRVFLTKFVKAPSGWGDVWNWIAELAASIADAIGGLVCGLINQPGASTAAAATGPVGIAAGAGIEIAKSQGVCQPEQPAPPAGGSMGWILPVALAGGALVVVLAMRK